MFGGFIGQFLPLAGGKLNGPLSLGGNALNMNTGGGGGGGNIHMDGGAIFVAGGEFSMNDGGGSGGDFFNADSAFFNAVGGMSLSGSGAGISLAGGTISLNGGSGSGGGNVLMDGGKVANASLISANHHSGNGQSNGSVAAGTGAGATISLYGNDTAGTLTVTVGTGPTRNTVIATVTFNRPFDNAPSVILQAANSQTASLSGGDQVFVGSTSTTTWTLVGGNPALATAAMYKWYYLIIE